MTSLKIPNTCWSLVSSVSRCFWETQRDPKQRARHIPSEAGPYSDTSNCS